MVGRGWAVVVPVKRLPAAKSRLREALPGLPHDRLALAFAQDTVAAALACPAVEDVLVVTDDRDAADLLGAMGALVAPEGRDAGLNAALAHGAELAAGPGRWVAALTADLPALRPEELAAALWAADGTAPRGARPAAPQAAADAPPRRWYVADAPGTGTTLLAVPPGRALDPRFGPDSAAAHAASGASPLTGDWPTLCRDVDTVADLAAAAALGVGPHTGALLAAGWGAVPAR